MHLYDVFYPNTRAFDSDIPLDGAAKIHGAIAVCTNWDGHRYECVRGQWEPTKKCKVDRSQERTQRGGRTS